MLRKMAQHDHELFSYTGDDPAIRGRRAARSSELADWRKAVKRG